MKREDYLNAQIEKLNAVIEATRKRAEAEIEFYSLELRRIEAELEQYKKASPIYNERDMIVHAFEMAGRNRRKMAELLNMSERTVYRKLKQFNIDQ